MIDPFEVLGIQPTSDKEAIRKAYHQLAKKWHPDRFQDADSRETAQRKMISLNEAYEACLRRADELTAPFNRSISCEDAMVLAERMMKRGNLPSALRQLLRAEKRSAAWFNLQGKILTGMNQYESAMQSYREAVRLKPDSLVYRRDAFDAELAYKHSKTVSGRLEQLIRRKKF